MMPPSYSSRLRCTGNRNKEKKETYRRRSESLQKKGTEAYYKSISLIKIEMPPEQHRYAAPGANHLYTLIFMRYSTLNLSQCLREGLERNDLNIRCYTTVVATYNKHVFGVGITGLNLSLLATFHRIFVCLTVI